MFTRKCKHDIDQPLFPRVFVYIVIGKIYVFYRQSYLILPKFGHIFCLLMHALYLPFFCPYSLFTVLYLHPLFTILYHTLFIIFYQPIFY